jgi:hypothetical protein
MGIEILLYLVCHPDYSTAQEAATFSLRRPHQSFHQSAFRHGCVFPSTVLELSMESTRELATESESYSDS